MNAERKTFRFYVEWMEMFFIANSIVKLPGERNKDVNRVVRQRKRAISLTKIGPESYSTGSNLKRGNPLVDTAEALEVHDPAPEEITDNFHFETHHQPLNKLISADFVVALKQLSSYSLQIMVIFSVERPVLFVDKAI